ncbi:kinetochore component CENP-S-domain-containing protein [Syncephalastrum racemosum]|uniref:Kinetochore component CENP-S-domain-containing protein n=1 Tax=Syncephalastrum racemosum TaxID=13706 RepID=A0A1X2H4V6_SYNRA|nr:kinetochore component CENP-S-domain-containing protein [Syncephalastrum racemosum]
MLQEFEPVRPWLFDLRQPISSMETTDGQEQELKVAVWHTVERIAKAEAQKSGKQVTPDFVASLSNVVFEQISTMALDLEAFAKHAKRSTISMEDVKMCARRNDDLAHHGFGRGNC